MAVGGFDFCRSHQFYRNVKCQFRHDVMNHKITRHASLFSHEDKKLSIQK